MSTIQEIQQKYLADKRQTGQLINGVNFQKLEQKYGKNVSQKTKHNERVEQQTSHQNEQFAEYSKQLVNKINAAIASYKPSLAQDKAMKLAIEKLESAVKTFNTFAGQRRKMHILTSANMF